MVTQKWDYQGGGLGKEESGIKHPVEAYKEFNKHGLGYGQPTIGGTSRDGHAFQNVHNELIEVKHIPEEVEKRAYDDIPIDDISLGDSILHELSIHLIDLPLTHPELIDWGQPSILHVDEFPTDEALLRFMGAETPHKKLKPHSAYVCNINPKGYFGEIANPSDKGKDIKDQKQPSEASHNKGPIPEDQHENSLFPPLDFKTKASAVLVEESRPVNISLTNTPRITYIATSLPQE